MVGIASGAYSSIFIASPVLTHWKERESSYRSRRARIVRELGAVPAYAVAVAGEPVDTEPEQKRRRTRRGSLIAPEEPGAQISREEFQELVRDLDVEDKPAGQGKPAGKSSKPQSRPTGPGRAGVAERAPAEAPEQDDGAEIADVRDPAADLTPEDLVLKEEPQRREKRRRSTGPGSRRRKHGRSR
jgi:SecD/SecF fusion protein